MAFKGEDFWKKASGLLLFFEIMGLAPEDSVVPQWFPYRRRRIQHLKIQWFHNDPIQEEEEDSVSRELRKMQEWGSTMKSSLRSL